MRFHALGRLLEVIGLFMAIAVVCYSPRPLPDNGYYMLGLAGLTAFIGEVLTKLRIPPKDKKGET